MSEITVSLIDNLIFIIGGVSMIVYGKRAKRPYLSWFGVIIIVSSILLAVREILKFAN